MKREAHVVFGFALGFFVGETLVASVIGGIASAAGAWFPDLDIKYRHRALLHNLFFPLALLALTFIPPYSALASLARLFILGWVSHLLADALTVSGVALFYPLTNKRSGIALFRSDSAVANLLIIAISVVLTYVKLSTSYNIPLPRPVYP